MIASCTISQANPFKVHPNQLKKMRQLDGPPYTLPAITEDGLQFLMMLAQ